MPTFSTIPVAEARARSATGKRAALLQEYVGYIGARCSWRGREARSRRGRDDAGDPAQAQFGGGCVGEAAGVPADS